MVNELAQITSIGCHLSSLPPRLRVLLFMQYRNILFYPHFHLANAYFKKLKLIIVSIGVIVVAGSALLLFYLQYNITLNSQSSEENRPIRIACSEPWVGYVPIILAVDRYFKENNVKVELIQPENQTTTEESFLNGSVDGLCSIFTTTIFQNSEGVNSRLVWVLDYSGTGDVILGPK
ncbi:MAG: hypothetical protein WAL24_06355, partial [Nitrososphaeraceae archaeon]